MFAKNVVRWVACAVLTLAVGWMAADEAKAQGFGSQDYEMGAMRRAAPVDQGVVLQTRWVTLTVPASTQSRVAGGVVGAGVCAGMSSRVGDWAVRGALSTACALGGERLANRAATEQRDALEVIVKLANGRVVAVTQEVGSEELMPGDTVYIIRGGQADRVVKG